MKEELIQKVSVMYDALNDLKSEWDKLDWSLVPERVTESYPFHKDLGQMEISVKEWLNAIKKT